MAESALTGIRVVELGQGVSAAFTAKLYSDYGAEVLKIETPKSGDRSRSWGPYPDDTADLEKSGLFFFLNTNKRSITLDLETEKGRELAKRLIADADVVIENNPPKKMREWGLDYASLEADNPNLVMISITPFGQTGPYADWNAYDLNAFHLTGSGMRYCGQPDKAPLQHGTYSAEFFGGFCAVTWGLAAIIGRDLIGGGQHVDVSCSECITAIFTGAQNIGGFVQDGNADNRTGIGMALAAPATIIPCKDGYVWMMALEVGQWHGLVKAMGSPDWAQLDLFDDMYQRAQNSDMIYPLIHEWAAEHTKQEIMDLCQDNNCPTTAVYNVGEMAELPHLKQRGYIVDLEHPALGAVKTLGPPVHLTEGTGGASSPAPLLGQHNDEVFVDQLGLSQGELETLRESGVI